MARIDDKPDQKVFYDYGLRGFPTVLVLDHDGEVLYGKRTDFLPRTPEALTEALDHVAPLFAARAVLATADATPVERANAKMRIALVKPGAIEWKEVRAAAEVDGVDPKLAREVVRLEKRYPFETLWNDYRRDWEGNSGEPKKRAEIRRKAQEATYRLSLDGKGIEDPTDELYFPFVVLAFDGAILSNDESTATKLLRSFEELYPNRTSLIETMKAKLEAL